MPSPGQHETPPPLAISSPAEEVIPQPVPDPVAAPQLTHGASDFYRRVAEAELDRIGRQRDTQTGQWTEKPPEVFAYDRFKSWETQHRTIKTIGYVAGTGLPAKQPDPNGLLRASTPAEQAYALHANLQADAVLKNRVRADYQRELYGGYSLGDPAALKDELAAARLTASEKRAIKKAARLYRRCYRSAGRIIERLEKTADGEDRAGRHRARLAGSVAVSRTVTSPQPDAQLPPADTDN